MSNSNEPTFACDVMLGGLARWLRAAGYDAVWSNTIEDWDLVRLAQVWFYLGHLQVHAGLPDAVSVESFSRAADLLERVPDGPVDPLGAEERAAKSFAGAINAGTPIFVGGGAG